jgi:eukaryotic-like serine/threonine-protein kinase
VPEIATADWSWLNAIAERFEQAAKHGRRPPIEDYLTEAPEDRRAALLDELLRVELELRRRAGEEPAGSEFRRRFPDYIAVVDAVFGGKTPEGDCPESDDPSATNGSATALSGEGDEPRLLPSTIADLSPGEREDHSQLPTERVPAEETVSFRNADTLATGDVPGSTISAAAGASTDHSRPGPGMPGWRVGRYLLVERLGGGAQGQVWRAVQLEPIVRTVALKLLPPGIAPDDERVSRLCKEAERGGGLSHHAILPIYEFGSCDGYTYLTMQLVEGIPLSNLLARRRAWVAGTAPSDLHRLAVLPEPDYIREIVRLLARIARALEHAHAHRVVHRDVKPSNILLERENEERAFLSDFGLARNLDDLTTSQSSSWVGTLPYMGPEKLLDARAVDEIRCDVFSLGVTLFESVALARPIELPATLSAVAAAARLATTEPRRPRALEPRIPRDLEAVILKAIDRNPSLRYPTACELADDLDRFLRDEPVLARPPGWARKTYRSLARRRVPISLLGVAALVAAVSLIVSSVIAFERAARAANCRKDAEGRLAAGRLDEADELAAIALSLVPGHPATAALIDRLKSERRDDLEDAIDRGDVLRAWRDWHKLRPSGEIPGLTFDRAIGLQPVRVVSDVPGARVVFHAQRSDGRPKEGAPLYELIVGPPERSAEDLLRTMRADVMIIPGAYWVTAVVDGGSWFVERPFEVRRDRESAGLSHLLWLHPKTTLDAASGMVEIKGGTLKMGSNDLLPGAGPKRGAPSEYPEHEVPVRDFYIDRTEVTNRAFVEFLVKTGREDWRSSVWPDSGGHPDPAHLDWPVTHVKYDQAVEFAAWRGCCLPDEAQLEWAARGPAGLKRPANVPENGPSGPWARLHAVDADPLDQTTIWPQPIFGLFGNAGELTLFRFRPYPNLNRVASGRSARNGFVVRSGAFRESIDGNRLALGYLKRGVIMPEVARDEVGFRCVRSIETRARTPLNSLERSD